MAVSKKKAVNDDPEATDLGEKKNQKIWKKNSVQKPGTCIKWKNNSMGGRGGGWRMGGRHGSTPRSVATLTFFDATNGPPLFCLVVVVPNGFQKKKIDADPFSGPKLGKTQ